MSPEINTVSGFPPPLKIEVSRELEQQHAVADQDGDDHEGQQDIAEDTGFRARFQASDIAAEVGEVFAGRLDLLALGILLELKDRQRIARPGTKHETDDRQALDERLDG